MWARRVGVGRGRRSDFIRVTLFKKAMLAILFMYVLDNLKCIGNA